MTASQAFWPRKKLHRPHLLLKQPSEHLRSQGIGVLQISSVEMKFRKQEARHFQAVSCSFSKQWPDFEAFQRLVEPHRYGVEALE